MNRIEFKKAMDAYETAHPEEFGELRFGPKAPRHAIGLRKWRSYQDRMDKLCKCGNRISVNAQMCPPCLGALKAKF